ncbi:MAG: ribosome-associated translation inhibitor RaiA [Bacteroidales bacterium]|nr:ribosome-associated translation inhibitor RaiA [Bacteroidales bacterium]
MRVKINSVHFKTDKKLDEFISEKMDKLLNLHDNITGSEVTLRVDNTDEPANKIAEIRLMVPGNDLFARKQSKSFEEATDTAVEALRRQLAKHKEKQRGE